MPKDQLTVEAFQDFVDGQLSDIPTDHLRWSKLAKHCWPEWGPHWGGWTWAAAIVPTWTKDRRPAGGSFGKTWLCTSRKVGLPKPNGKLTQSNEAAPGSGTGWLLDQLIMKRPKRRFKAVKCAGCGFPRQLKPGETHCYACRNLSEAPKLASLPGPAIWKTDEYEKVIEDNIRRYHQEAHGPAPEDAKVEAVGAALDAG